MAYIIMQQRTYIGNVCISDADEIHRYRTICVFLLEVITLLTVILILMYANMSAYIARLETTLAKSEERLDSTRIWGEEQRKSVSMWRSASRVQRDEVEHASSLYGECSNNIAQVVSMWAECANK